MQAIIEAQRAAATKQADAEATAAALASKIKAEAAASTAQREVEREGEGGAARIATNCTARITCIVIGMRWQAELKQQELTAATEKRLAQIKLEQQEINNRANIAQAESKALMKVGRVGG